MKGSEGDPTILLGYQAHLSENYFHKTCVRVYTSLQV